VPTLLSIPLAQGRYSRSEEWSHVKRAVGIVIQRCPDLPDALVYCLFEVNADIVAPKLLLDFLAGDELPSVTGEQSEKPEGLRCQPDKNVGFGQLVGHEI
jgi:hypothetical protein